MTNTYHNIVQLTKQLFPDGRAFRFFEGGVMDALVKGIANSEARVWNDALAVLDSILPDNENFSADDATDWERRLGIASGGNEVVLADRKAAIIRKLNHPGTVKTRQSYLYLEGQLRAAGFDVYVHENRFDDGMGGYETRTAQEVTGQAEGYAALGNFNLGEVNLGAEWLGGLLTLCVNYLEEEMDANFEFGNNLRSTFFITGGDVDVPAVIPHARKTEFRQLILLIKPVQTAAILYNYYI